MLFGPKERLLVRSILSDVVELPEMSAVNGTVITTGDQLAPALAFAAAQEVPATLPWVTAPQV